MGIALVLGDSASIDYRSCCIDDGFRGVVER
jgi:hypothetical protein